MFGHLAKHGGLPLGAWATPTDPRDAARTTHPALLAALSAVHGSDNERERRSRLGSGPYTILGELHKRDYDAIVPRLARAARAWTVLTLSTEASELSRMSRRITQEPGLPERLHAHAVAISESVNGFDPTEQDLWDAAGTKVPAATTPVFNRSTGKLELQPIGSRQGYDIDSTKLRTGVRARIAKRVREEHDEVLSTLFAHPRGIAILAVYAEDAARGTRFAVTLIDEAKSAVEAFRDELADPRHEDHIWRYPALISGGVALLGLGAVPGFTLYSIAVGQVLSRSAAATALGFAGVAILCLALVFAGPAGLGLLAFATADMTVAGSGALLAAGAADVTLAGMSAGLAYLREREAELGAGASALRDKNAQFATSSGYVDTALAGAAALLSAIAFFGAAKQFRQLAKARSASIDETLSKWAKFSLPDKPPPAPPNPRATSDGHLSQRGVPATTSAQRSTRPADPLMESRAATRDETAAAKALGTRAVGGEAAAGAPTHAGPATKVPSDLSPQLAEVAPVAPAAAPAAPSTRSPVTASAIGTPPMRLGPLTARGSVLHVGAPPRGFHPPADGRVSGTGGITAIGERILADNTTEVIIEGRLLDGIRPRTRAPNFNLDVPAGELGLVNYDAAHLWGPGFGDEAAAGIMHAPASFNRVWQAAVESRMRDLHRMAKARGGEVWVSAIARSHPRNVGGGNLLREVEYVFELRSPLMPRMRSQVSISVGLPPGARVSDATVMILDPL